MIPNVIVIGGWVRIHNCSWWRSVGSISNPSIVFKVLEVVRFTRFIEGRGGHPMWHYARVDTYHKNIFLCFMEHFERNWNIVTLAKFFEEHS